MLTFWAILKRMTTFNSKLLVTLDALRAFGAFNHLQSPSGVLILNYLFGKVKLSRSVRVWHMQTSCYPVGAVTLLEYGRDPWSSGYGRRFIGIRFEFQYRLLDVHFPHYWAAKIVQWFFKKMGQPQPLFCLFLFFSNKHYDKIRTAVLRCRKRPLCQLSHNHCHNILPLWPIKLFHLGQCLWLSWQSDCFQFKRSAVRIQSSAKFILNLFVNCIEKTKIKKKKPGKAHFFKKSW